VYLFVFVKAFRTDANKEVGRSILPNQELSPQCLKAHWSEWH